MYHFAWAYQRENKTGIQIGTQEKAEYEISNKQFSLKTS